MLESLQIQNFQCHSRLRIVLDPAVTTIVGDSDRGKSAIIRALRWVTTNVPTGDAFIRVGSSGTTVSLRVDGNTIRRRRGKGKNEYALNGSDYKAFGANVPDPIAAAVNVCPVNFSGQHDASFWFSLSPPEVSRQLNAVVDLGIIDDALAAIATTYHRATAIVNVSKERLESACSRTEELAWVPQAAADFDRVSTADANHAEISARMAAVGRLVEDAMELTRKAADAVEATQDAVAVGKKGRAALGITKQRKELVRILASTKEYEAVLARGIPDTSRLDAAVSVYQDVQTACKVLASTMQQLKAAGETQCQTDKRADAAAAELEQAMGGRCPICGGKIDGTKSI